MATTDEQLLTGGSRPTSPATSGPPPDKVAKAVEAARADGRTSLMKVLYLDDKGDSVGEWSSSQIPENPWDGIQAAGLQEPPFRMEQLVYLAETHPVHSSALDQKTADICGKGWVWEAHDPDAADEAERDQLELWFQGLAPDDLDMQEVIHSVWLDVETVGWGCMECARDPQGVLRRLYHVPGHTVKAHKDGFRLCQVRDQRKVWFRRWGATDIAGKKIEVDEKTGSKTSVQSPANDMFVVKRPSRRSTWYGIPGYVSAIGWITLALAARDDNLLFFANRREPRWAIILTGLADDGGTLEADLRRAFTVDLAQPYRNLVLPLTGPGKVDFQKLSDTAKDGSFGMLSDRSDKSIMIAHRVPAERLANADIGPLGGNSTAASNRIYKDAVVNPGQELLNTRLQRMIDVEYEIAIKTKPSWKIQMDDLDVSSEREDLDLAVISFHADLITLREARHKLGKPPLMKPLRVVDRAPGEVDPLTGQPYPEGAATMPIDPLTGDPYPNGTMEVESEYNDMLFTELPGAGGQGGSPAAMPPGSGGLMKPAGVGAYRTGSDTEVAALRAATAELLTATRAQNLQLEEMVEIELALRRSAA